MEYKQESEMIPQDFFFIVFRVLLDRRGNPTRVSVQIDSDIKMVMTKDNFLEAMKKRSSEELYNNIYKYTMNIGDFYLIDVMHNRVTEILRHEVDSRLMATEMTKLVAEDKKEAAKESQNLVTPGLNKDFNNLNINNKKDILTNNLRVFTTR